MKAVRRPHTRSIDRARRSLVSEFLAIAGTAGILLFSRSGGASKKERPTDITQPEKAGGASPRRAATRAMAR